MPWKAVVFSESSGGGESQGENIGVLQPDRFGNMLELGDWEGGDDGCSLSTSGWCVTQRRRRPGVVLV